MEDARAGDLEARIRAAARVETDPAGRELRVLAEHEAVAAAAACGCSVRDAFLAALRLGIRPRRYLRNAASIGLEDQLRLANARVAVVGAGGLGGYLILHLARLGVGELVVVDHDVFDETNLNRQALSSVAALGKPKAQEARAAAAGINPGVEVVVHRTRITEANIEDLLAGVEVAADALDNVQDRLLLDRFARRRGIPLVHGALAGFEGQVMAVFPEDPGLAFLYGDGTAAADKSRSPEALLGVPTLTPPLIATLQAMEVLKILLGRGRPLRRKLLHIDLENAAFDTFLFDAPGEEKP